MKIYWRFLQDWDNEFEGKFDETSIVAIKLPNGWLVGFDETDTPISWYDVPDVDASELFSGH